MDRPYPGAAPCNTSLQACIDGATAGDTIVIQAGTYVTSFTLNKAVSLTGVSSATVILHALPDTRVLEVTGAAISNSVVISGLTFTGGSLAGSNCSASCGGGVLLRGSAQPLLLNVIITGNSAWDGGGLYAASGSLLRMTNSQVLSNTSGNAGGGALVIGAAMLNGGLFQGNQCTLDGCNGGGLRTFSILALTGTQFLSNSASATGGGVSAFGAATLNGGLFQGNAASQGGGLFANDTLALTGTQFFSNTAGFYGGAVRAWGAVVVNGGLFQANQCTQASCSGGGLSALTSVALSGTQFISNTSNESGGGAYSAGATVLDGGLFQANQCTQGGCQGGGLYTISTLTPTRTQFLSNSARLGGGGVLAGAGVLTGGLFQGNFCTQDDCDGGGLYTGDTLSLTGTHFLSNTARQGGGGVYAFAAVVLNGGLFQGNDCTQDDCTGGGLHVSLGSFTTLTLAGTHFLSNTARQGGGGVYTFAGVVLNGGLFQGNDCTLDGCTGGGLYAGGSFAPLTLTNMQFISNSALSNGGGVFAGGPTSLTGGLFQGNAASRGGGLSGFNTLALTGTQFLSNTAISDGGGVVARVQLLLNGGLFQGNAAAWGGALSQTGGVGHITNTLFANNTAVNSGAAIYLASPDGVSLVHNTIAMSATPLITPAVHIAAGSVGITNTLFANHATGIHRTGGSAHQDYNLFSGVITPTSGGVTGGANSLTGAAGFSDPTAGDYHLTLASDAIDAGANAGVYVDFEGHPRPQDAGFDIGYDENILFKLYLPIVMR